MKPPSLKARAAIREAVFAAQDEVCTRHIHNLSERPPEDWDPHERLVFDIATAVEMGVYERLKVLWGEVAPERTAITDATGVSSDPSTSPSPPLPPCPSPRYCATVASLP